MQEDIAANKVAAGNEVEGEEDGAIDINETDIDQQERVEVVEDNIQKDGDEEEADSKEKIIRFALEQFLNGEPYGILYQKFLGFISFASCISFIALTYTDWSREVPCCRAFYIELDRLETAVSELEAAGADIPDEYQKPWTIVDQCIAVGMPLCNQYYYSRMP